MIAYTAMHLRWQDQESESANVSDVSIDHLHFRVAKKISQFDDVEVAMFYDFDWHIIYLYDYQLSNGVKYPFCYEYVLEINDEQYRQALKQFMMHMNAYIETKHNDEVESIIDYPIGKDHDFYHSYDDLLKDLMPTLKMNASYDDIPLGISLNDPHHYEMFLNNRFETFRELYFREYHLNQHPIAKRQISALYIGNSFCFHLFPQKDLLSIVNKAKNLQLSVVVVLPPLRQRYINQYDKILISLVNRDVEIVVNDIGLWHHLREHYDFKISLGILMNRHFKDSRLQYKQGHLEYLKEVDQFVDDIEVISSETCGYHLQMHQPYDLYFPKYLTNASGFCTMYARCRHHNRGKQEEVIDCPRYCLKQHFLYPKHLRMIGQYNCLFGYDLEALEKPADDQLIRRLVFTC